MSDYTPTTEDVRRLWVYGFGMAKSEPRIENEAFDRWLAQHDAEVAAKALDAIWSELAASSAIHTLDAAMVRIKERANQWKDKAQK